MTSRSGIARVVFIRHLVKISRWRRTQAAHADVMSGKGESDRTEGQAISDGLKENRKRWTLSLRPSVT
jgi:hypothetical protein